MPTGCQATSSRLKNSKNSIMLAIKQRQCRNPDIPIIRLLEEAFFIYSNCKNLKFHFIQQPSMLFSLRGSAHICAVWCSSFVKWTKGILGIAIIQSITVGSKAMTLCYLRVAGRAAVSVNATNSEEQSTTIRNNTCHRTTSVERQEKSPWRKNGKCESMWRRVRFFWS